jgi:HD-GYP domain-containing protein (c-di-GMP phosphodiesterase class II)
MPTKMPLGSFCLNRVYRFQMKDAGLITRQSQPKPYDLNSMVAIPSSSILFETLSEAVLTVNLEWRIVAMNLAAETLYGVQAGWAIGRPLIDLIGNEIDFNAHTRLEALQRGETWNGEHWHHTPTQRRFRAEFSVRSIGAGWTVQCLENAIETVNRHSRSEALTSSSSNDLEHLVVVVRDISEIHAERSRQTILTTTMQALAESQLANTARQATLKSLLETGQVDAVIFNDRAENDTFRLVEAQGLDAQTIALGQEAHLTSSEIESLELGQTIQYNLRIATSGPFTQHLANKGFTHMVTVGKRSSGQVIGSLVLLYRGLPALDLTSILPSIGAALGAQLSRIVALKVADQRVHAFQKLAELSAALEAIEDPGTLAQRALETLLELTGLEAGFWVKIGQGRVWLAEQRGQLPDEFYETYHGSTTSEFDGETVGQILIQQGNYAQSDVQTVAMLSNVATLGVRSICFGAVKLDGILIGYVAAASFTAPHEVPSGTLEVISFIAKRIGRALERTQGNLRIRIARFEAEARAKAFNRLATLSAELETLTDARTIAKRGLETLLELTGLDGAEYYEYSNNTIRTVELCGTYPPGIVTPEVRVSSTGLISQILKRKQPMLIEDYQQNPTVSPNILEHQVRTVIFAPVMLEDHVHGFVSASSFGQVKPTPDGTLEFVSFLCTRIARALERADQIQEIYATRAATFQTLGLALEARDFETKGHTDRVVRHSLALGQAFKLDDDALQSLEWGAYLHDFGKIAIPDAILLKPSSLTQAEWKTIRQHPQLGYDILEELHFLPLETLQIVRSHQERMNGTGYPDGLIGAEIPFLARLFAVVDVFDALISQRPYKQAWTLEATLTELKAQAGIALDAEVVNALIRMLEQNPAW